MHSKIVCFCVNPGMYSGFLVSLASLIAGGGLGECNMVIYQSGLETEDCEQIRTLCDKAGYAGGLEIRTADLGMYQELPSLQGDWMTYQRLSVANDYPSASLVLYVDSDMLFVGRLIDELMMVDFGGELLAAGGVGPVRNSLERNFYSKLGMSDDSPVFNAGLLLINAKRWRDELFRDKCITFGKTHFSSISSADQTILNGLLQGAFHQLPQRFNDTRRHHSDEMAKVSHSWTFHFAGSPKPWDLAGMLTHPSAAFWRDRAAELGLPWWRVIFRKPLSLLRREKNIFHSSCRSLFKRIVTRKTFAQKIQDTE